MQIKNQLRFAVSALAATILYSAPSFAQPLAMNDPGFFFPGSIFQQVVREPAPQAYATPDESVTDEPAGVVDERFRRQMVNYNTSEAPGTIVIDTPNTYLYLRARQRPRDALRHRRRPRRLHLGRHADRRPQGGMAGLASAGGDDRAPAVSAALHGRRPGQSARRARHVSRQHACIASTAPTRRTTIGQRVSSGCIRLTNDDVTDLFNRVKVGAKVVVLPMNGRSVAQTQRPAPVRAERVLVLRSAAPGCDLVHRRPLVDGAVFAGPRLVGVAPVLIHTLQSVEAKGARH